MRTLHIILVTGVSFRITMWIQQLGKSMNFKLPWNSEVSARWNNATPKTLWINVIPSAINTDYKYQHNSLIGANMVSLAFESAVYDILILTGNGRTYGTTVANTFTDDPYWKSTIQASFDSNTGTVTFRILFKGSSQIFNNLALKAVTYLKIG